MVAEVAQSLAPPPTAQDVLHAAERLITQGGVEALSMRRLAASLGTSYQVVYSRIGSKADVARALHDEGLRRLSAAAEEITAAPGTDAHLLAMAQGYLAAAAATPAVFDLIFGAPMKEFTRDRTAKEVERQGFEATWVNACRAWLDARYDPRPRGAAVRLAWRLWTAVHGITVLHLAGHDSPSGDIDAEIATVVELLLSDPLR